MGLSLNVHKGLAKKQASRQRRQTRGRKRIFGAADRPRLVVRRPPRHMFAQVIHGARGGTRPSAWGV